MSFTQENKTNINIRICNGCKNHCEFGIHHYRIEGLVNELVCPTIAGTPIKEYRNRYGRMQSATRAAPLNLTRPLIEEILCQACDISRLCDHYKTR